MSVAPRRMAGMSEESLTMLAQNLGMDHAEDDHHGKLHHRLRGGREIATVLGVHDRTRSTRAGRKRRSALISTCHRRGTTSCSAARSTPVKRLSCSPCSCSVCAGSAIAAASTKRGASVQPDPLLTRYFGTRILTIDHHSPRAGCLACSVKSTARHLFTTPD